jgi:hypothetical protein
MRFRIILLGGMLAIFLTACTSRAMVKPPRPTLEIIPRSDGGICLDRENSVLMGRYILELEAGYE